MTTAIDFFYDNPGAEDASLELATAFFLLSHIAACGDDVEHNIAAQACGILSERYNFPKYLFSVLNRVQRLDEEVWKMREKGDENYQNALADFLQSPPEEKEKNLHRVLTGGISQLSNGSKVLRALAANDQKALDKKRKRKKST